MAVKDVESLRESWNEMYRHKLPAMAKAKDAAQSKWPVALDHCFARIILDNAVGKDQPWASVVKAPATKNMTTEQLQAALKLGDEICEGKANLQQLDQRSLDLRGKTKGGSKAKRPPPKQPSEQPAKRVKTERGSEDDIRQSSEEDSHATEIEEKHDDSGLHAEKPKADKTSKEESPSGSESSDKNEAPQTRKGVMAALWSTYSPAKKPTSAKEAAMLADVRKKIQSMKGLTPFRRHVLMLLTQVPRGRYTTYKAMADAVPKTSDLQSATTKGCARSIGVAMRNNPFAPAAPCHRVIAADGRLGGFKGDWGEEGRFAQEKQRLLAEEGVKFDSRGKVYGSPFTAFERYMD